MVNFKEFELSVTAKAKIIGGNGGGNGTTDEPIVVLGTVVNDGAG